MLKSLVLLAVVVCHASGKMMTDTEIEEVLKIHNNLRRAEGASDMKEMKWDPVLGKTASVWADLCVWEHGHPKDIETQYDWVGQNLFMTTGKNVNITYGTENWFSEKKNYVFDTNECNGVCGHYTQVVWSESEFVGCAVTSCPTLKNLNKAGTIFVCNYGPGGNYVGEQPYKRGAACSECRPGYECKNGLCYKP